MVLEGPHSVNSPPYCFLLPPLAPACCQRPLLPISVIAASRLEELWVAERRHLPGGTHRMGSSKAPSWGWGERVSEKCPRGF